MDTGSSLFSSGRSALLDCISSIKSSLLDTLGVVEFPIPQFILIGKQSVGKSRLVEALAGETFNFVSGTLGSRRPTILEFRNVTEYTTSRWQILNTETNQWELKPIVEVMQYLGDAHESLGCSVTDVPVYVRIESAHCIDMQLVDLPGFRDFAKDGEKAALSEKISILVEQFMADPRSVMLCVEEAGDAANLASLSKCRKFDAKFERTILIRNKLDKYYRDLTADNVAAWLDGFGDLPPKLVKFSLTLPNWKNSSKPPKPFVQMRIDADARDVETIRSLGGVTDTIGYSNFAAAVGNKLERMFSDSIVPVMQNISTMKEKSEDQFFQMQRVLDTWNPLVMRGSIREAAISFGRALTPVMEGFVQSNTERYTLLDELKDFHDYHKMMGSDFPLLPSSDFYCLEDYVYCLENDICLASVNIEVNGGAQYRRLINEIDVFCRFAELSDETKEIDVIQARGVSVHDVTWSDVVVKLLANEAHDPMKKRIQYAAERLAFFFRTQKAVTLDFMSSVQNSSESGIFSELYSKYAAVITENDLARHLIFEAFDNAVERQKQNFLHLFNNTLTSIFSNPWVFLKKASAQVIEEETDGDPTETEVRQDSRHRVPNEINTRLGVDNILQRWLANIPSEASKSEIAVDMAQILLLKTFEVIRCNIADQLDLYAESFFKWPMLRRLDADMSEIEISESEMEMQISKQQDLEKDMVALKKRVEVLAECEKTLKTFRQTQNRLGSHAKSTR